MTLQHFTIADLQRALHDGELSAREIARQTLDDIARVNPQINAWTEVTAQRMLAEADSIDALRREKRPPPPVWPATCAIPPSPPLARTWRCAAPSLPVKAAPALAASSKRGCAFPTAGGLSPPRSV